MFIVANKLTKLSAAAAVAVFVEAAYMAEFLHIHCWFLRGELGKGHVRFLFPGGAVAIVLYGPRFLPGERRMMTLLAVEQRPPLPVVCPHLQDSLFERTRGERVEDGVQGTIDGQNEYDHPGANGT